MFTMTIRRVRKDVYKRQVYEHLDDPSIKPGVRKKLAEGREMAYTSRKLGEICCCLLYTSQHDRRL